MCLSRGMEISCPLSDPRAQVRYLGCLSPHLLPCQSEIRPGVLDRLNTHPGPGASQAEPFACMGVAFGGTYFFLWGSGMAGKEAWELSSLVISQWRE